MNMISKIINWIRSIFNNHKKTFNKPETLEGKKSRTSKIPDSSKSEVKSTGNIVKNEKTSGTNSNGPLSQHQKGNVEDESRKTIDNNSPKIIYPPNHKWESLTKPLNENIFKSELLVNYSPNAKYIQDKLQYFPIVYMPPKDTVIKPPVTGRFGNKGYLEESFCSNYLLKYFKSYTYDNLSLFIGTTPYAPDFTLIDISTGKNLLIDIEIDEPYDAINKVPTHYLIQSSNCTSDDDRNQGFINRGWLVIRFAEEQILLWPNECCKFIFDVVKSIIPGFEADVSCKAADLTKVKIWSEAEARNDMSNKTREKYLKISEFTKINLDQPMMINDSKLGIEIEKKLKSKIEGKGQSSNFPLENVSSGLKTIPITITDTKSNTEEPRITTKTERVSQPSAQPYGKY